MSENPELTYCAAELACRYCNCTKFRAWKSVPVEFELVTGQLDFIEDEPVTEMICLGCHNPFSAEELPELWNIIRTLVERAKL